MIEQEKTTKIKFNPAILIHSIPKNIPDIKSGPITIADINAEIGNMDGGIEFIAHTEEKDHLLDTFMAENANNTPENKD